MREASYLVGFRDFEPWPKAVKQFVTEFEVEDGCAVCTKANIG